MPLAVRDGNLRDDTARVDDEFRRRHDAGSSLYMPLPALKVVIHQQHLREHGLERFML